MIKQSLAKLKPEHLARLVREVQDKVIQKHKDLFLTTDDPEVLDRQEKMIRQEVRLLVEKDDLEIENYIVDHLIGYKELGPFFRDPEVTDILINGPDQVYIEKSNKTIKTDITFDSFDEVGVKGYIGFIRCKARHRTHKFLLVGSYLLR